MHRSKLDIGSAGRRSWRHVNQLRLKRCWRVWHGRVVIVVRRLCHGPFHRVFGSGLQLDVLGEELNVGVECRGLFDGFLEVGIAVGHQWTPTGAPHLVFVAEVHGGA